MKDLYESPTLIEYGPIADRTFATPNGNVKGGGPCWHYDKFWEQSGVPCS